MDDVTLMAQVSQENCNTIHKILTKFWIEPGQTINTTKSKIFVSMNCQDNLKKMVIDTLNINRGKSFGKYLGGPIINKKDSINDYRFIVDNLKKN